MAARRQPVNLKETMVRGRLTRQARNASTSARQTSPYHDCTACNV
jgi:hypothetical protein